MSFNNTLKWNHAKGNIGACEYKGNILLNCCCGIQFAHKNACGKEIEYILMSKSNWSSNVKLYIFKERFTNDTYEKCYWLKDKSCTWNSQDRHDFIISL